jgi:acetyl esterase/lipase
MPASLPSRPVARAWAGRLTPYWLGVGLALVLVFAAPPLAAAQERVRYGPGAPQIADLYAAPAGAPTLVWVTGGGWVLFDFGLARPSPAPSRPPV